MKNSLWEGEAPAEPSSSLSDCLRMRLGRRFARTGVEVLNRGHKQKWQSHMSTPAKRLSPAAKTCHDLPRSVRSDAACFQGHRPSVQSAAGITKFDLSDGPAVAEDLSADVAAITCDVPSGNTAQDRLWTVTVCHSQMLSTLVRPARTVDRGRFRSRLRGPSRRLARVGFGANDGTLIIGVHPP